MLVTNVNDLPQGGETIYLDFETTSGDPKKKSLNPWMDCEILGICFCNEEGPAYYIPVAHHSGENLPRENVLHWLIKTVGGCKRWINHNIKYDAHVYTNAGCGSINCELVDTLTLAKLVNSDRFVYNLESLSKDWLGEDISGVNDAMKPYLHRNKDYGAIPIDVMEPYGCQDVLTTRKLYKYLTNKLPERSNNIWQTEIKLTSVLYDMENEGLHVNKQELQIAEMQAIQVMLQIEEEIHTETGLAIRPHTNADCYDILCGKYQMPVLGYTEKGDASFDKHILASYLRYPGAPQTLVKKIMKYRELNTLRNIFLVPYQNFEIDGILHSDYNQCVRTGRLSCSRPNAQQMNEEAKSFIHPKPGYFFADLDYSQIEFRLIVHYINDATAIAAYNENPNTDFHQWVANMCKIDRGPAKNINFAMAFGGGRKKVLSMLASDMSLVGQLGDEVEKLINLGQVKVEQREIVFKKFCLTRAEEVYDTYHETLPNLKRLTYFAARKCKDKGFVFNAYGRHRQLPERAAFRAFNTIIQSTAADIMKERTVATSPRFNKIVEASGITQVASVHDSTLFQIPKDDIDSVNYLKNEMENVQRKFSVPIRVGVGQSDKSWADAGV